jgi:AcrR family transcriptional regulator
MSSETTKTPTRAYRKRRRAEAEQRTRERITEATAELHGTVGPARTTVSAIAERAGVQRATVYRHFPDEVSLYNACSAHWMAQNPLPDLTAWDEIADPDERLHTALAELYAWYDRGEYMLEKTTRDVALVESLRPAMEAFAGWFVAALETVARGRRERGARRRRVRAAIGHALEFETWRSLVRRQELSEREAVQLMVAAVEAAALRTPPRAAAAGPRHAGPGAA